MRLTKTRKGRIIAILTAVTLMLSSCAVINGPAAPREDWAAIAIGKQERAERSPGEDNVTTYQGTELPLEVIEDALEPIGDVSDPSAFDFEENVDLDEGEIAERFTDISDNYELGEPLSLRDLELVRAYAPMETLDSGVESPVAVSMPPISSAMYSSRAPGTGAVLAKINWWTGNGSRKFSKTRKAQGVSAKLTGTLYVNTKWNGIGNTWRIKSTGAIIAGKAKVSKNTVSLTFNGYGAVARWPYVGLVYKKTAKASNGKKSVSIDLSYRYDALLSSWSAVANQTVRTKNGTFNVIA